MIKPELLKEDKNRGRGALAYLDMLLRFGTNNLGGVINGVELDSVPRAVIERHYELHKEKDYYPWLVDQCTEQPAIICIYEGEQGLNEELRKIIGNKDPAIARTQKYRGYQTVRGRFSSAEESLILARKEKRGLRNGIHASSDILEAIRELEVWQQYFRDTRPSTIRELKRWHASNLCRVLICYRYSKLAS